MANPVVSVASVENVYQNEYSNSSIVTMTFTYSGTTAQNGTAIYYAATLTDDQTPSHTENVLFKYPLAKGSNIPATSDNIEYVSAVPFSGTITGTLGKVYYVK